MALASGFSSCVRSVELGGEPLAEAFAPMSIVVTLEDELDIGRGDMLCRPSNPPSSSQDIVIPIDEATHATVGAGMIRGPIRARAAAPAPRAALAPAASGRPPAEQRRRYAKRALPPGGAGVTR